MALVSTDEKALRPGLSITGHHCVQKNTPAFVSRLPTELLEAIFAQLARDHFCDDTNRGRCPPDWPCITRVSSHWRRVALNYPILWSFIPIASRRCVETFLARSEQAPLKICVRGECKELFELFFNNAGRVEEIRFYTSCWDMEISEVWVTLCASAPRLRTLEFSMYAFPKISPRMIYDKATLFPWFWPGLAGLTTLSLHSIPDSLLLDVAEFQAVLSCMPDLLHLYLDDALASAGDFISSEEFNALRRVDLPRLSRLLVVAPVSTIIAFLSSVNIPAPTRIRLECNIENNPSHENYSRLYSVLAQNYSKDRVLSLPTIRSVVMKLDFEGLALGFSASLECDHLSQIYAMDPLNWCSNILLEIVMELPWTLDNSVLGRAICAFMPTIDAQTLHIIAPPSCPTFWRKTWEYFPCVRRMKLSSGSIRNGLASVFLPRILADDESENYSGGPVLASVLEELELDCMQFEKMVNTDDSSDHNSPPFEELRSLCATLCSRKGSEGRFIMTECYAYREFGTLSGSFPPLLERSRRHPRERGQVRTISNPA